MHKNSRATLARSQMFEYALSSPTIPKRIRPPVLAPHHQLRLLDHPQSLRPRQHIRSPPPESPASPCCPAAPRRGAAPPRSAIPYRSGKPAELASTNAPPEARERAVPSRILAASEAESSGREASWAILTSRVRCDLTTKCHITR